MFGKIQCHGPKTCYFITGKMLNFGASHYLHIEKQVYFSKTVFFWPYLLWKPNEESYRPSILFSSHCLKRNDSQTFQSSNCKKRFIQCVCHCYTWFWCFLLHVTTEKTLFFKKVCQYTDVFSIATFLHSLKQIIWKRSAF